MEFLLWALVILKKILDIYLWMVIFTVISSWLVAFGILNMSNTIVRAIVMGVARFTEPPMEAVRRVLPSVGGLDFSPIVIFLAIQGLMIGIEKIFMMLVGIGG